MLCSIPHAKFPLLSKRFPHARQGPKMALLLLIIWRKISSFDNDVVWFSSPELHRKLCNLCQHLLISNSVLSVFNGGWIACEHFTRVCHCWVLGLYVVNNCSCEKVWEITILLGNIFSIPFEKEGKKKDRQKEERLSIS